MRQTLTAATAAFIIGGVGTGAVLSRAQTAAPPIASTDGQSPNRAMMGWHHRHGLGRGMHGGDLALIFRQPDRQLTPADVQKIAEAFLLWNGNHTWKVTGVAVAADGPVGFSLSTAEGSTVARFTMDPHTGKIDRVG